MNPNYLLEELRRQAVDAEQAPIARQLSVDDISATPARLDAGELLQLHQAVAVRVGFVLPKGIGYEWMRKHSHGCTDEVRGVIEHYLRCVESASHLLGKEPASKVLGLEVNEAADRLAWSSPRREKSPVERRRERILELLRRDGHDPLNLPERGPKAKIKRIACAELKISEATFDSDWDALRKDKKIVSSGG